MTLFNATFYATFYMSGTIKQSHSATVFVNPNSHKLENLKLPSLFFVMLRKKDREFMLCFDYRKLSSVTH